MLFLYHVLLPVFFFFGGDWGSNSGLHTCKAGALPLCALLPFYDIRKEGVV
jgi:hypothetical protein